MEKEGGKKRGNHQCRDPVVTVGLYRRPVGPLLSRTGTPGWSPMVLDRQESLPKGSSEIQKRALTRGRRTTVGLEGSRRLNYGVDIEHERTRCETRPTLSVHRHTDSRTQPLETPEG